MTYQRAIKRATGCTDAEARRVEALLRGAHPTLDGLSAQELATEARAAQAEACGIDSATLDRLAGSFGL